jgi:hypothetical protein
MAKPLDQRIAAALGASARAATVSSLIDEVQDAMQACQAEHDRLDALSKSATAAEDEADDAADQVFKLSRKLVRLAAKRDQLQARHDELMTSERRERLAAKQRLEAQNAQWRDCIVTPPADCANSIPISTYRGEMRVQRQPKQFKMTDEAIADARAKGCDVELLPAGKTLGMPSSVAVF